MPDSCYNGFERRTSDLPGICASSKVCAGSELLGPASSGVSSFSSNSPFTTKPQSAACIPTMMCRFIRLILPQGSDRAADKAAHEHAPPTEAHSPDLRTAKRRRLHAMDVRSLV